MGRRPGTQDPPRQVRAGRGRDPPPRYHLRVLPGRARRRRRVRPLPGQQEGLPRLRHRAGQRLAHCHRDNRGRGTLARKGQNGHNGRKMGTRRRRGHPETPRPERQWRLRRLLALPPPPRARTHPPRQIPRRAHPRSVTSSPQKSRTQKGLPLDELYRQLFNPQLYLLAFFRTYFCPFYVFSYELDGGGWRRLSGMADGWHSEVGGSGAAVSFDASVGAGELAFSGFQADFKALDFAEPAVHPRFGDALVQVADDLGKAGPLVRRDAEHCASKASVFMLARYPVRAAAGAQRDLAHLEVLLEFLPFLVGGLAVFSGGPGGPPLVEECAVGADQVVLEDGHVRFRGGQAFVAENPGCDVHGQPAGDGCRREAPAEIVGPASMIQGSARSVADRIVPVFGGGSWLAGGGAARCARVAPAPAAPGRPPFRRGDGVAGQSGAGRAHSRCQQARNASFQGQVRLIFSVRARAWRTIRANRLSNR